MGMKEAVNFARTTIKYTTSDGRIIPYGGLLIPGQRLEAIGFDRIVNSDEDILELHHKHGEMEQYHSEIKTDLFAEQLPSGKFATKLQEMRKLYEERLINVCLISRH